MAIDRFNSNDRGITPVTTDQWSLGWTSIVPLSLNNVPHILSYKSEDGTVDLDRIKLDGSGTANVWSRKWDTGWSSIVPLQIGGAAHTLSYNSETGTVDLDKILEVADPSTGKPWVNRWSRKWDTGWNLLSFALNNQPHILSFKEDGHAMDIDRILEQIDNTTDKGWVNLFSRAPVSGIILPLCQPLLANETLNMDRSQKAFEALKKMEGFAGVHKNLCSGSSATTNFKNCRVTGDKFGLYNDPSGFCTMGFGHLLSHRNCDTPEINNYNNSFPGGMTLSQAENLLNQDLHAPLTNPRPGFVTVVNANIHVKLTQEQFDALVFFAFNVGPTGFTTSNLVSLINQGNCDPVAILKDGFLQPSKRKSGGDPEALHSRRCMEADLFNNKVYP
jgi:GH24 family phage-related lysozyme (muramidase)